MNRTESANRFRDHEATCSVRKKAGFTPMRAFLVVFVNDGSGAGKQQSIINSA
jgi:hypothetical protein